MTLEEIDSRIAQLEELRDSGITETSTDGTTIKFRTMADLESALSRLYARKRKKTGKPAKHPWASPFFG